MQNTPSKDRFDVSKDMTERAEYYGNKRGSEWKEAHRSLVYDVRRAYQHYINTILKELGRKLSEPHNGWDFQRQKATEPIVDKVEKECRELQRRSRDYRNERSEFDKDVESFKADFPDINDEFIKAKGTVKTRGDRILLVGLLLLCVVVEAGVNVSLLASALTTGMLGAFVIAVLVSFLNVGIVGASVGVLFNHIMRQPGAEKKMPRSTFPVLWGTWLFAVLLLNFFFGRHRENFARIAEQHEAAAQAAYEGVADSFAQAAESVTGVSWNILNWQFESVLFFFLGIGLCIFAFYKTFTFSQPAEHELKGLGAKLEKLATDREKIKGEFEKLPEKYRLKTEELRAEISQFVQSLDFEHRQVKGEYEDLKDDWVKNQIFEPIEAKYVMFYNENHSDKIDLETLMKHREEENIDTSFPATPADDQHLTEARAVLDAWKDEGKDAFFESIAQAGRDIRKQCDAYREPVLVPLDSKWRETFQPDQHKNEPDQTENE